MSVLNTKFGKIFPLQLDMEVSDSAEVLVKLALQAGDPFSAAAVYSIAKGKDRQDLEDTMFSKRRDALALARWEHTPPSVLEALSTTSDTGIVVRLDKNQNTPTSALSQLYAEQGKKVSSFTVLIAQHRSVPPSVLNNIAKFEADVESLLAVSKNLVASSETLAILLDRFKSGPVLEALQKNISEHPAATPQILEQLYCKGDVYVRAAAVSHTHCPQTIFEQAEHEESVLIQRQIAADRRLRYDMILRLSKHQDKSVRSAVASNASLPKSVVRVLASDESDVVRRAVAIRSDLTQKVVNDLSNDVDVWVRQKLARNPIVSLSILGKLSKDTQADVRRGVARNPRCSVALLSELANDADYWVRAAVAYQRRTPKQMLESLARDTSVDVLSGVANNANTPQRFLKKLASSTEPDVRRGVILNKSATRATLLPLLEDDYYLHRLMLVANHQLKDVDKWSLCFDPDYQVRFTAFRYFAKRFIKSSG